MNSKNNETTPTKIIIRKFTIQNKNEQLMQANDFFSQLSPITAQVYQLLSHRGAHPPPAMGITPSPFVVSVSSTAKIIAPGLRVGWIEASEDLVLQLTKSALVMSGGSISHFSASVVGAAMRSGLAAKCVSRLVNLHQKRACALCEVDIQLAMM